MFINKRPIAILLAVYNGEKYLAEQIDSVLSQTEKDWTLYIRDDGSKDATVDIIHRYCEKYPDRIVAVEDGLGNLGCRDNFFRLLEVVDSAYYMFCDADDVWYDFKIRISMDRMKKLEQEHPDTPILVVTDYTVCDGQLNVVMDSGFRNLGIYDPKPFLNEVPPRSHEYDAYIGVRAAQHALIDVLMVCTKKYRLHGANYSGVRLEKKQPLLFRLREAIEKKRKAVGARKAIGWGGYFRYFYWKAVVASRLRKNKKQWIKNNGNNVGDVA